MSEITDRDIKIMTMMAELDKAAEIANLAIAEADASIQRMRVIAEANIRFVEMRRAEMQGKLQEVLLTKAKLSAEFNL